MPLKFPELDKVMLASPDAVTLNLRLLGFAAMVKSGAGMIS